MNRKILFVITTMLLIATVYPVVGVPNLERSFEEQHNLNEVNNNGQTGSDDWWPMFRHDAGNTGSTSSIAPNTNQLSWKEMISEEIFSASPVIVDDRLYISTGWYYGMLEPPNMTVLMNLLPIKTNISEGSIVWMLIRERNYGIIQCMPQMILL